MEERGRSCSSGVGTYLLDSLRMMKALRLSEEGQVDFSVVILNFCTSKSFSRIDASETITKLYNNNYIAIVSQKIANEVFFK